MMDGLIVGLFIGNILLHFCDRFKNVLISCIFEDTCTIKTLNQTLKSIFLSDFYVEKIANLIIFFLTIDINVVLLQRQQLCSFPHFDLC